MSADVADEGWRGKGRTRRAEPPAEPQPQPQPQPQLQSQEQQQLEFQFQQQLLPSAKVLKSSSPDLSSPNLSDCESVPTPARFRSRVSSPNAVALGPSASANTADPPVVVTKNAGDAGVKNEKQESVAATGTTKVKRTRRKKEDKEPKEKNKETKPRKPRTSNAKINYNGDGNNANENPSQSQNQHLPLTDDNADRAASRKRPKLDHPQDAKPSPPSRQSKITDLVTPHTAPISTPSTLSPTHATSSTQFHLAPSSTSTSPRLQPHLQPNHPHPIPPNNYDAFSTNGESRPPYRPYHMQQGPSSTSALAPAPSPAHTLAPSQQQPQPARTSGQHYDPIRSAFDNSSVTAPQFSASSKISLTSSHQFTPPPNTRTPPPRPVYRASASPAISSIIDPPIQPSSSAPPQPSLFHQQSKVSPENSHSAKHSPVSATPISTPKTNTTPIQQPKAVHQPLLSSSLLEEPVTMDIDSGNNAPTPAPSVPSKLTSTGPTKKGTGASTGTPSTAPSPKPSRTKDTTLPPLPSGSGLLAGTLFGVDAIDKSNSTSTPNIILHIPLNGKTNQIINFTRLAEEQYGFDALHPRLAAQRERLARVNAASAALERNEKNTRGTTGTDSAAEDDLSLDADRDSDGDGDVLMSGMGGSSSLLNGHAGSDAGGGGGAGGSTKKKRRRKIEEYDRDDPFVDDSELAWQEQAAASKDGFFVYSGPLIPEGEKVAVERYVLFYLFCCFHLTIVWLFLFTLRNTLTN